MDHFLTLLRLLANVKTLHCSYLNSLKHYVHNRRIINENFENKSDYGVQLFKAYLFKGSHDVSLLTLL